MSKYDDMRRSASRQSTITCSPGKPPRFGTIPLDDDVRATNNIINMKWFGPFMYGVIVGVGICLTIF